MYVPPHAIGKIIEWHELSFDEQQAFLRMGYKPPEGTIIHGNLDIEVSSDSPLPAENLPRNSWRYS